MKYYGSNCRNVRFICLLTVQRHKFMTILVSKGKYMLCIQIKAIQLNELVHINKNLCLE